MEIVDETHDDFIEIRCPDAIMAEVLAAEAFQGLTRGLNAEMVHGLIYRARNPRPNRIDQDRSFMWTLPLSKFTVVVADKENHFKICDQETPKPYRIIQGWLEIQALYHLNLSRTLLDKLHQGYGYVKVPQLVVALDSTKAVKHPHRGVG